MTDRRAAMAKGSPTAAILVAVGLQIPTVIETRPEEPVPPGARKIPLGQLQVEV